MTPRSSCPGGDPLLSGAQTSGSLRIQHCSGKLGGAGSLPPPPPRGRGSATDGLGHFWQADLGHFSRAPKEADGEVDQGGEGQGKGQHLMLNPAVRARFRKIHKLQISYIFAISYSGPPSQIVR